MSDFAPFERKKPGSPPPQSSYTVYDDSGTHALESLHSTDRLGAGDHDHALDIRGSVTSPFETLSERLLVPEHSVELVEINELYGHHAHSITSTLFSDVRHGLKVPLDPNSALVTPANIVSRWRQKDRLKTTAVALVVCLNIGVDPPDVIKISPCARMECWMDPLSMQAQKALDTIGKNLQRQYERWQPRAKYKIHLDPTSDEVKKLVSSCRRSAKGERVLFHYNGHGVPRPTSNGTCERLDGRAPRRSRWMYSRIRFEMNTYLCRGNLGVQQVVHAVHPAVDLRSSKLDGIPGDLYLRLFHRRSDPALLQAVFLQGNEAGIDDSDVCV